MIQKLKSRKFLLALVGVLLPIAGAYLSGDILIGEAITLSVGVIVSYIFGQGYVDGKALEGVTESTEG